MTIRYLLDTNVLSDAIKSHPNELTLEKLSEHDGELATCSIVWHARERARLSKRGRPPSAADGQIAAIAGVNELTIVTANVKVFRRFKDLVVEDWSR